MKISAFRACLLLVYIFLVLALISWASGMYTDIIGFFIICAVVFTMILPACNKKIE